MEKDLTFHADILPYQLAVLSAKHVKDITTRHLPTKMHFTFSMNT